MAELNEKQMQFCREYIIDLNATQAAKRAGYSAKTAKTIGQRQLTKVDIQKHISQLIDGIKTERIATATEVMEYLTSVMRREHKETVVVTIREETSSYVPDDDGKMRKQTIKTEVPELVEIPAKLSDANKAAELLGKRYGIYTEKLELSGEVGVQFIDNLPDD